MGSNPISDEILYIYNLFGFLLLYADIYICICILILLGFSVILNESILKHKYKFHIFKWVNLFSCFSLVYALFVLWESMYYEGILLNYQLICDNLGFFVKFLLIILTLICLMASLSYFKYEELKSFEYPLLVLLALLGILTIISSFDLITMYLAIELQSLCFYIITCLKVFSNFSVESGLKYFILGAFSSGMLLFGSSLLYGFSGTTNFLDFLILFDDIWFFNFYLYFGNLIGFVFILCGIFFKIGVVPFHLWVPDIYEGAPTVVSLFFATVPQLSILVLLFRLNLVFAQFNNELFIFFLVLGGLSILIGTLGAINQSKLKRLLAFSAISNVGYSISVLCFVHYENYFSSFFFSMIYILSTLSLWLCLLIFRNRSNFFKFKDIFELFLLFKSNNKYAIIFSLILFSAIGIPPMLGFFGKFYVFLNIFKLKLYFFSILLIIFSSLGVYYYLRIFKTMYSYTTNKLIFLVDPKKFKSVVLLSVVFLNLFFFIYISHPQIRLFFLIFDFFEFFSF